MELWKEHGFPHKGWKWKTIIDLRLDEDRKLEEYEDCEACGHERIRFVHVLKNPEYPRTIRVGCVCAEKLTDDYVAPRAKEQKLRTVAARRQRFPSRKWKTSSQGNIYLNIEGLNVGVMPQPNGKFKVWIGHQFGKLLYNSLREAQLRIFDVLEHQRRLTRRVMGEDDKND